MLTILKLIGVLIGVDEEVATDNVLMWPISWFIFSNFLWGFVTVWKIIRIDYCLNYTELMFKWSVVENLKLILFFHVLIDIFVVCHSLISMLDQYEVLFICKCSLKQCFSRTKTIIESRGDVFCAVTPLTDLFLLHFKRVSFFC